MIGLVVRQMDLQQLQVGIDPLYQPEATDQAVHRRDPAETRRVDVAADLETDPARVQHRRRPRTPMPRPRVPRRHPATAACHIPTALIMRYLLHHKGLSVRSSPESSTPGKIRPVSYTHLRA